MRQPVCDACRSRKVRCDKLSPCSSCKASHIPCRTTQKTVGRRPRSQTTTRYEQDIIDLESKVEQLSKSLLARSEGTDENTVAEKASFDVDPLCNAPSSRQRSTAVSGTVALRATHPFRRIRNKPPRLSKLVLHSPHKSTMMRLSPVPWPIYRELCTPAMHNIYPQLARPSPCTRMKATVFLPYPCHQVTSFLSYSSLPKVHHQ